jgi:hypothetical protein
MKELIHRLTEQTQFPLSVCGQTCTATVWFGNIFLSLSYIPPISQYQEYLDVK